MDNYNYPMGADTANAPWNQSEPEKMEIEVTVSITLSKTVKVSVTDYEYFEGEKDEDDYIPPSYDFSNCDLEAAVKQQLYLPQEVGSILEKVQNFDNIKMVKTTLKDVTSDMKDWIVDDMEIVLEE